MVTSPHTIPIYFCINISNSPFTFVLIFLIGDPNSSATVLSVRGEYLKRSSLEFAGTIRDKDGVLEEDGTDVLAEEDDASVVFVVLAVLEDADKKKDRCNYNVQNVNV
ncbi:hypothetical protein QE152_g40472 [Popillia japonica]|uniref:Uncharacterized protein n=1 Tax=Popillia japonica TaxID=7064 RepID=A0AAW1HG34_POPJA